jgi:hypothetical protein
MPDIPIRQSDIDSLGQKLGTLESTLSDSERALLASILAIASDAIRRSSSERSVSPLVSRVGSSEAPATMMAAAEGPLPSIRDQFSRAFTPGTVEENDSPSVILTNTIPSRGPRGDEPGSHLGGQPVHKDDEAGF